MSVAVFQFTKSGGDLIWPMGHCLLIPYLFKKKKKQLEEQEAEGSHFNTSCDLFLLSPQT